MALTRKVSAAGVLLVLSASVLGLALVLVPVPVPVPDFGVARVVTVVAGVRFRSRSLRPAGASVRDRRHCAQGELCVAVVREELRHCVSHQ